MARKTSVAYEKTKETLLAVGLNFFEEKGYNATGISEIAQKAEIPKGSFYTYFGSKEAFGQAVIRYYTQQSLGKWTDMLEVATEKEDAYGAICSAFMQISENYDTMEMKRGCLLGTLAAEISEASKDCRVALQESIMKYIDILTKRIEMGQQMGMVRLDVPAHRLAELVWDAWQGSLLRMKIEKSVGPVRSDLEVLFEFILKS